MSGVRVDVGAVYGPRDLFYVKHASLGTATVNFRDPVGAGVTAKSVNAPQIAALLNAHVNDHHAQLTASESSGVYTVASSGSAFNLVIPDDTIRAFLGLPETSAGVTTVSGTKSPGVFLGSRPPVVTASARWLTRRPPLFRGRAVGLKVLKRMVYRVQMSITAAEIEAWRPVARYILQGQPFSVYQDTGDLPTAWSYAAPTKNIIGAMLTGESESLSESQVTGPYLSDIAIDFECMEYA